MPLPNSVAVFCGSRAGASPRYAETARAFGQELAARNIKLVYGGGKVGLMGEVADAATAAGGAVHGVIPEFLMKKELGNDTITSLEVTDSMHSRKRRMFELSGAFVALAGGLGTIDEMVEIITWKQLRLHNKPIIFLNEDGYWDGFSQLVGSVIDGGFAPDQSVRLFSMAPDIDTVFALLADTPSVRAQGNSERL